MKPAYFCDTSAIIKLYHAESGTEYMAFIFENEQNKLILSELTLVEFESSVSKKVRTGDISNAAKKVAIKNFNKDCRNRFILNQLNSRTIKCARDIIGRHGDEYAIRTLDALQLAACLMEEKEGLHFVCADSRLNKISRIEGIITINPETCAGGG